MCDKEGCKNIRDNFTKLAGQLATISWDRQRCEQAEKDLADMKNQMVATTALIDQKSRQIYELSNQKQSAKDECERAKKREEEMEKQLKFVEDSSANMKKKAEAADIYKTRCKQLAEVCEQLQQRRVQLAETLKDTVSALKDNKKENGELKNTVETLKTEKSDAMNRLKLYKKHLPNLFKLLDELIPQANNINYHMKKRVETYVDPEMRRQLLQGIPSATVTNGNHDDTSDEELDDIAALISGAPKPPAVDTAPVPRFKVPTRKTPVKAKEAPKEVEKEQKVPVVLVIEPKPSTSRKSAVFEPKGRRVFNQQKHNVEAIEKAMQDKIQQKLTRNEEENEKRSDISGGHSTIHGKKGLTVREQQSGMMSVKEKVAMMREEENKKGLKKKAPEPQPSTSSDPFAAFESASSPKPERQRTLSEISHSSDKFGLRMTPSPSASPLKSTPTGSLQSLADDAFDAGLDLDFEAPDYEPIESTMPSAPSMPHLDAVETTPIDEESRQVPVQTPATIAPAPSMPHLEEALPAEERLETTAKEVASLVKEPISKTIPKKVQFQLADSAASSQPEKIREPIKGVENPLATKITEAPKPKEAVKDTQKVDEQTPSKKSPTKEPVFSPTTNKALRNMSKISAELTAQITPIKSKPERPQAPKAKKPVAAPGPSTSAQPMEIEVEEDVPVAEPIVSKRKAHAPKVEALGGSKPVPKVEKVPEPVAEQENEANMAVTVETAPEEDLQKITVEAPAPSIVQKEPSPIKRVTRRSQSTISEKEVPSTSMAASEEQVPVAPPSTPIEPSAEDEKPAPKRKVAAEKAPVKPAAKPATEKKSEPSTSKAKITSAVEVEPVAKRILPKRRTRSSKDEIPAIVETIPPKSVEKVAEPAVDQEPADLDAGDLQIAIEEDDVPEIAEVKNLVDNLAPSTSSGPKPVVPKRRTRSSVAIKAEPAVETAPEPQEEVSSDETESPGELQILIEGVPIAPSEDSPKTAITKLMARISKNVGDKQKFVRGQTVPREKKTTVEAVRKTSEQPAVKPDIQEPTVERRVTRTTRNTTARYTPTTTPESVPKQSKVKPKVPEQATSSVHQDLEMTSDEEEVISPRKKKHIISSDEEEEPVQEPVQDLPADDELRIVEEEREKRAEEEKPSIADLVDIARPVLQSPPVIVPGPSRRPIANVAEFRPVKKPLKTSLMSQVQKTSQAMARRLQAAGNRRLVPGARVVRLVRNEEPVPGPSGLQKEPEGKKTEPGPSGLGRKEPEEKKSTSIPLKTAAGKTKKIEIIEPKATTGGTRTRGRNPPPAPVIFKPVKVPAKRKAEQEIFSPKKMKTHASSAESILIKALDMGCNEQEILKRMAPEELEQIATIGAERFAEIMMEYVIRMNRVDMWHSVVAMHRNNSPGPITNTMEENLLQISHSFSGENADVITPFIRKCMTKIFTQLPIDELLCHKIIRLITMGYRAQIQISGSEDVQAKINKELKALVKFLCFHRPNFLGKSLVYMINRLPLEFLADEEFLEARHLLVLYSEDVLDIFHFFWDATMKKEALDTVIILPTRAQIDQWIADRLHVDRPSRDEAETYALRSVFLMTHRTFSIVLDETHALMEMLEKIAGDYRITNKEDDIVGSLFGRVSSSSLQDPESTTVSQMLVRISGLANLLEPITRCSTIGQDKQKAFFFGLSKTVEKAHEIAEFLSSHIGKGAPNQRVSLHGGLRSFFQSCQRVTKHQL